MSQINPFTHVVFQSIEVHRRDAVEKEKQLRRESVQEKDIAARDDTLEHQVESTEEVRATGDEAEKQKQRRKRLQRDAEHAGADEEDQNPHLDLTA